MPRFDPATVTELNRAGFAELPGETLTKLAGRMERQEIAPGQPVVLEGEEGNHFYCVISGVLALNQGGLDRAACCAPATTSARWRSPWTCLAPPRDGADGRDRRQLRPRDLRRVRQAALRRQALSLVREREDAFGRTVLDHLEGRRAHEIVEQQRRLHRRFRRAAGVLRAVSPLGAARTADALRARPRARRRRRGRARRPTPPGARPRGGRDRHFPPLAVEVARRRGVEDARAGVQGCRPEARHLRHDRDDVQQLRPLRQRARRTAHAPPPRSDHNDDARIVAGSRNPYSTDSPDHLA